MSNHISGTAIPICQHWIRPDLGLKTGWARCVPTQCPWCEIEKYDSAIASRDLEIDQLKKELNEIRQQIEFDPFRNIPR